MSEPTFTEFGTEEWNDSDAFFEDASDDDFADRETELREIVGEPILPDGSEGIEKADDDHLDSVIAGFRARAGKEADRHAEVTLADCYSVVCFATRDQREAFLAATGWVRLGRGYIDGRRIAEAMGIDLPPDPEWPATKRDRTWDEFSMTVEENRALPD